jgi:hypothetical protein
MATVRKIRKIVRRDSAVMLKAQPGPRPTPESQPPPSQVAQVAQVAQVSPGAARIWYVHVEDCEPVGPVSAEQIARGVRAGKVPSHATVRLEHDLFWSDLLDVAEIVLALKEVSVASEPPPPSMSPPLLAKQYFVWVDGTEPIGPVSADQIARGIRAGKVPAHASIQRNGDLFATDVLDEPDIIAALKLL